MSIRINKSASEMIREGFSVDRVCYPWVAYKGSRFKPDEWYEIPTDREVEFSNSIRELKVELSRYKLPDSTGQ